MQFQIRSDTYGNRSSHEVVVPSLTPQPKEVIVHIEGYIDGFFVCLRLRGRGIIPQTGCRRYEIVSCCQRSALEKHFQLKLPKNVFMDEITIDNLKIALGI